MIPVAIYGLALLWSHIAGPATPSFPQAITPGQIAAKARPAVVLIKTSAQGIEIAQGTGFVVDPSGLLVTNFHVIKGAEAISVQLASGEVYDTVFFVSANERQDIAVLKIAATDLPFLTFGDDHAVSVGDTVFTLGNPRGLEGTFSNGMVSATRVDDGVAYVQITAPISPGSSGGPVLNSVGEVVAIATAAIRDAQNLNLAVAARYARGMLAMGERPVPLSDAQVALRSTGGSPSTPPAPSGGDSGPEVKTWEKTVNDLVKAVDETFLKDGYEPSHEVEAGYLNEGETVTKRVDLAAGVYYFVGVCDGDCSDLDLGVYAGSTTIGTDTEDDDMPLVKVNVTRNGEHRVLMRMVKCTNEPCYYAIRVLRQR